MTIYKEKTTNKVKNEQMMPGLTLRMGLIVDSLQVTLDNYILDVGNELLRLNTI